MVFWREDYQSFHFKYLLSCWKIYNFYLKKEWEILAAKEKGKASWANGQKTKKKRGQWKSPTPSKDSHKSNDMITQSKTLTRKRILLVFMRIVKKPTILRWISYRISLPTRQIYSNKRYCSSMHVQTNQRSAILW